MEIWTYIPHAAPNIYTSTHIDYNVHTSIYPFCLCVDQIDSLVVIHHQSLDFDAISEEVILAEERTTEEEKMHIMEGKISIKFRL